MIDTPQAAVAAPELAFLIVAAAVAAALLVAAALGAVRFVRSDTGPPGLFWVFCLAGCGFLSRAVWDAWHAAGQAGVWEERGGLRPLVTLLLVLAAFGPLAWWIDRERSKWGGPPPASAPGDERPVPPRD